MVWAICLLVVGTPFAASAIQMQFRSVRLPSKKAHVLCSMKTGSLSLRGTALKENGKPSFPRVGIILAAFCFAGPMSCSFGSLAMRKRIAAYALSSGSVSTAWPVNEFTDFRRKDCRRYSAASQIDFSAVESRLSLKMQSADAFSSRAARLV